MANHTNWINISSMSGSSGQTILTITANTNTTREDKYATIKAYNPVYNISATTTVLVSAYTPYIYVNPSIVGVPGSGGTYQFSISSNCSYVIAYPDLVTSYSASAGTGNTNITFTVSGTSASTTLVGNIVITDTSGQYSTLVRVEQYGGGVSISYSPSAVTIPFTGGSATFTVTANCTYDVNKGSGDWYSVSPQSGYTGATTFTVSSSTVNSGNTNWTSNITIVCPTGTVGTVGVTEENAGQYRIDYTADTSTVAASGETRVITIDATDVINSSITVSIQGAPGATYTYTQSSTTRGVITVNIPNNTGSPRDITVIVTGRRALSSNVATAVISYLQEEHITVPIPYTADTSFVDASGETRIITIDASNLVSSSITISVPDTTGITYSYNNGVITVIFPAYDGTRSITVNVSATTVDGDYAAATIVYIQRDKSGINDYLTFDILSSGTIKWITNNGDGSYTKTIEYKKNDGGWTEITSSRSGASISVVTGDILKFRGNNASYGLDTGTGFRTDGKFAATKACSFNVSGNIMSLVNSTNFQNVTTLVSGATFVEMFAQCRIIDASGLFLPATSLTHYCYASMFSQCVRLTYAPELPATAIADSCYWNMFVQCINLISAPTLPATTLADRCYEGMFNGCTGITTTPELPATTLADYCYYHMFRGANFAIAPRLPATTLADGCYAYMFQGCRSLTTAPELPATTLADGCYYCMFYGCTSLTTAPELPATILTDHCYYWMFYACSNLNRIKCLATDITAFGCTTQWLVDVSSNGTFIKAPSMSSWTTGVNGIPTNWIVQDAT